MKQQAVDIQAAAEDVYSRMQHGEHFPGAWRDKFSLAEAYRIQLAIRDLRHADGDRQVGWKIGLTSRAIQDQEGFYEPIFAVLYESGARANGARFTCSDMKAPGFEPELCITTRHVLSGSDVDAAQVRGAVATVAPALEVVEARGALSESPELAVADNLGQFAYVVGEARQPEPGSVIAETTCDVSVNGEDAGSARGDAVLDDPVNAVAWLVNKLYDYGEEVTAGQLVMSGSFTKGIRVTPSATVEARFDPFGNVQATFY